MRYLLLLFILFQAFPAAADQTPCGLIDVEIRGSSLAPLYQSGDHVDAKTPLCLGREITANDIVVFSSGASDIPLIKKIIAVPGDHFALVGGHLLINNVQAQNSEFHPYLFNDRTGRLIKLYEEQFGGQLPDDVFLVMGDHDGVIDSSRIGPVGRQDIRYVVLKGNSVRR